MDLKPGILQRKMSESSEETGLITIGNYPESEKEYDEENPMPLLGKLIDMVNKEFQ